MLDVVEEKLLARIRELLGKTVKQVKTHPGNWSDQVIGQMVQAAPSVYVGFTGGLADDDFPDAWLDANWHVFITARMLNGKREVGIYQMLQKLVPGLHDWECLRLKRVANLFSYKQAKAGFACYELVLTAPLDFLSTLDESGLDDFETLYATWDIDPASQGEPLTEAHIALEQEDD